MKKRILEINKKLLKFFGKPSRAKKLPDPLDMLIGTILSQNTNDTNSFKAYQNLKNRFKNWEEVHKASRTVIEKEIKVAGLGFQKSTAIKNLLNELVNKNNEISLNSIINSDDETALNYLTGFKGIGVKTASCVLLFSLDRDICPVDTHLHRTLNRIGLVKTKTPDKTFFVINQNFPKNVAHSFHTNLIRLGREICTPKNYKCGSCPVQTICKFSDKKHANNTVSKKRSFMLLDNI